MVKKNVSASDITWYVRDAGGNVMAVYTYTGVNLNNGILYLSEQHLYGSSRIGVWNRNVDMSATSSNTIKVPLLGMTYSGGFERGKKMYELSNHLGNVLVTISDKKIGHDAGNGTIDYYTADVVNATDYYPFGFKMPGRTYNASNYRYGFNGKEDDDEIQGDGNEIDYGMRVYDPRLGRFLSVDPLTRKYPFYTPYSYAGNKPIKFIDVDGLEEAEPIRDAEARSELEPLSYRMLATYARNAQSSYSGRSMFIPPSQYNNGPQTRTPAPIYEEPEEKGNGEAIIGPFITKGNEIGRTAKILTDMIDPENRKQFVQSVMSFVKNFETSYTHYNSANGEYETSEAMTVITWNNQEAADAFKKVYDQWKTKRDEIIKNTAPIPYDAPYMDPKNKDCIMCVPNINSKDATPEMVKQRMNDNMLRQGKRIFALLRLGDL